MCPRPPARLGAPAAHWTPAERAEGQPPSLRVSCRRDRRAPTGPRCRGRPRSWGALPRGRGPAVEPHTQLSGMDGLPQAWLPRVSLPSEGTVPQQSWPPPQRRPPARSTEARPKQHGAGRRPPGHSGAVAQRPPEWGDLGCCRPQTHGQGVRPGAQGKASPEATVLTGAGRVPQALARTWLQSDSPAGRLLPAQLPTGASTAPPRWRGGRHREPWTEAGVGSGCLAGFWCGDGHYTTDTRVKQCGSTPPLPHSHQGGAWTPGGGCALQRGDTTQARG